MNKTNIETPIGTLYAVPSGNLQNFPGIVVGLKRDGKTAEFVLVEVDKETNNLCVRTNNLCVRAWNLDQFVWCSDPVYENSATQEEIVEMMEGDVA